MQSERSWTEESAEVGRKSLRPKITRRVGSTKIARAVGPWAIFGEPERPKRRSWADGATMLQLIQQKIHSSAIPRVCKYAIACESKIFYWIRDSQVRYCKFIILDWHFCDPGIVEIALLAYALSLIYQDGFAEIRLKTLGLINANPFS